MLMHLHLRPCFIPASPSTPRRSFLTPSACATQHNSSPAPPSLPRRAILQLPALLAFLAPPPAPASTSDYDAYADSYDVLDGSNPLTRFLSFDALRADLLSNAFGSTLELAAGTGVNLPFYPSSLYSLVALDSSTQMLSRLRLRAENASPPWPLRVVLGDAACTLLRDAPPFDTVVITFGLCVVPDPAAVLREARRLVAPRGALLILDYTSSGVGFVASYQRAVGPAVARLSKGCRPDLDLLALLRDARFVVEEANYALGDTVAAIRARPI